MATRIETLQSRWRPEWNQRSDLSRLSGAFHKALSFIESVPATRSRLAGPGTLSAKGLNEAVRSVAAEKVVPDLRRAMWEAEKVANGLKNDMSRLAVPRQHDKTDVAGAMLRAEMRSMLREMLKGTSEDVGDRLRLIMGMPEFLEAAFEGPARLSGLTEEFRAELEQRMIAEKHGAAIEAIDGAKEAIELTQAAIEMAIGAVKTAGDFGDAHFNQWMATASSEVEREIAAEKATAPAPKTGENRFSTPTYELKDGQLVQNGIYTFNLDVAA
ncbi:hypothetical protein EN875_034020 [Mesorhizobium sp. M2D.F.Ca.ET.232.01.1.1]|uniref:hypothetical protein n=1 Tax=Mesorhizobium sp. M2D.F.Ca.ET.232.01.1.1 TaxID=2496670 RepID=UPI000FCB8F37|nr:hypothetical protein [Mesorhizobium sp. M2D.F.Ca.ET.232.01.1.1]TGP27359.1 hypothetical protein EN875_034020 [Mesorhizobium sp. M2D.F.Ca.ET.232.01.1.1]